MVHVTLPTIEAVGKALPAHYVSQDQLIEHLRGVWPNHRHARIAKLLEATEVEGRHVALLPSELMELAGSFGKQSQAYLRLATELSEKAVRAALDESGHRPEDIDFLFFVSITGIANPHVDVHLANRLGFRSDLKRVPSFGLGCGGGAAGLARVADYCVGYPKHVALLVSCELCSLTFQPNDRSITNTVATGLFGDGASAVVIRGETPSDTGAIRPRIIGTRAHLFPNTMHALGWDVIDSGFQFVLSSKIPELLRREVAPFVDAFLANAGLDRSRIAHWLIHPGGPRILDAIHEGLELPDGALDRSWNLLRSLGNLSSSSVLFLLADFMKSGAAQRGDYGILAAFGPGLFCKLVLLQW